MFQTSMRCSARALIFATACTCSFAVAQSFPSQPLEFVAHTSAGGGTDQFARLIAEIFNREKIVPQLPQISNRVGGGGAIAYNYVKGKRGDPHVILAVATGTFMSALTRPDLGFTIDDFTPLAFFAMDPQVVAVSADTRFNNVKELIDGKRKQDPGDFIRRARQARTRGHRPGSAGLGSV